MKYKLSEKWIKASIAGTIWAASEIVLGSFLHNLRVPFSGNILTAIGLIILISISYIWHENGIFWRAGLICAVMKTMSPSAIIFGPMIAIFAESLLLEFSVRIFGRNMGGLIIGAILAMSWNLFQKIANYIISYGSNIVEVYNSLLKFAQKQLNIQTDIVWLPIIVLLIVFALFGLLAGIIGIITGKRMLRQPAKEVSFSRNNSVDGIRKNSGEDFKYSVGWLLIDIALMVGSFLLIYYTPWYVWSIAITGVVIIWSSRYKRAFRQIMRPGFWIFFVLITLLTAFAFTVAQGGSISWAEGLLTGIQMNFRAAVIITGFAVLGTELYNPVIRDFFQKTALKNLPLALELSVESLPFFIGSIPDLKSLVRKPVSIFYNVLSQADRRLAEIKGIGNIPRKIFIISGPVGGGKTTFTKNIIEFLKDQEIKSEGILSDRITGGSETLGYDIIDISTGKREVFLRENEKTGNEKIGKFYISPKGLAKGRSILEELTTYITGIVIIDEVGLLELQGRGWHDSISELLEKSSNHILITVRDKFVDEVKKKWNLSDAIIFNVPDNDNRKAGWLIYQQIKN
ncbi:MAG TPA: nucleoside-triphosphatase [Bacteroidales bacterium]|jgi:nucleoside-triphosphatase THEP1|nr:nucleoside-triphosphatase [Bacteroidales bacterium]HPM87671.1 nucleoside-triphosphatase [Bacteroidales bacterium]HQM69734.1 nucleoside-triphosphatase [Bacteroidales bacterium]